MAQSQTDVNPIEWDAYLVQQEGLRRLEREGPSPPKEAAKVLGVQPDMLGGQSKTVRSEAPTETKSVLPRGYLIERAWHAKHGSTGEVNPVKVQERKAIRATIAPSEVRQLAITTMPSSAKKLTP